MKKLILFTAIAVLLTSCKSGSSEESTTQEIRMLGFKSSMPEAQRSVCSAKFLFFPTRRVNDFVMQGHTADSQTEFYNATDHTFFYLLDENRMPLSDGTFEDAEFGFETDKDDAYSTETLPTGKYFVCALCCDKRGVSRNWSYMKYCTKIIELKEDAEILRLSPVFPVDYTRYGLIPWTDVTEDFTYSWEQ